jgi:hypothetical protein
LIVVGMVFEKSVMASAGVFVFSVSWHGINCK